MKQINISEETYEKIKDQLMSEEKIDINELKDFVGKQLFIRTVTYHIVGKVEKIVGTFFVLSNASFIADSGRFMNAIKNGNLNEVEPLGDWFVNYNTITDMGIWKHSLNLNQK